MGNKQAPKKPYSNSYRSLEAIWQILRSHASRQHPLSVGEIHDYLKQLEDAPSPDTIARIFPRERELMDLLFPGIVAEEGAPAAVGVYRSGDTLHVVVETPEGRTLARDEAALEAEPAPFRAPGYSTIDKLLQQGFPFDLKTFPYRLRCVAREPGERGRLIPYEDWEEQLSRQAGKTGKDGGNNRARRYYLASALSDGEWRIFSDLVQVYPFITESQTRKFLRVLDYLRPGKPGRPEGRYAFKRGSGAMFRVIGLLDRAIREKRKVWVTYGEYHLELRDRRWTPVLGRREKNGQLEFEPYALMWSNGNYYLVGRNRDMMNLRVDRILAVEPTRETFTVPPDFDPVDYRDRSPVMYPGKRRVVRLRCRGDMLGVLLDFFGSVPQYTPRPDGTVEASMSIAPAGVKLFALQYASGVEVLEPEDLRREIAGELARAAKVYSS